MVNEAERFATEDKSRREAVETKNNAESLVYQTEKQIKELGDKVPADIKAKLDDKIKAVRWALQLRRWALQGMWALHGYLGDTRWNPRAQYTDTH